MLGKHLTNEEKLDQIYEMTLENNDILRSIRRQQYLANALRLLYWLVVLGALGSVYYLVHPVITKLSNGGVVEQRMNEFNQIRNQLPETKLIDQVVNGLKASSTGTEAGVPATSVSDGSSTEMEGEAAQ